MHGLYHQPAHREPLVDALEARGAIVHVPFLHHGSLAADTSVVQEQVKPCFEEPIVVSHSYGGAIAAGVQGAASFLFHRRVHSRHWTGRQVWTPGTKEFSAFEARLVLTTESEQK